jgi:hypothetical protein
MAELHIIILACVAVIFFVTYLLIGLLSKVIGSSKAAYAKTMDELEKDRSFKL